MDSFEKVCDFTSLLFFLAQFCNKILFSHKNLSLFEQGTMFTIITDIIDCEQSLSFPSVFLAFLRASVEL